VAPSSFHRPYRLDEAPGPALFFRDDRLSDLIGFEYQKWKAADAAANFVQGLDAIGAEARDEPPLVSVILDGENCWEHYDYNGHDFLDALYASLESHPAVRTTTFAAHLAGRAVPPASLKKLAAGSWSHASFSEWIGTPAKNQGWDLLCVAKQSYDRVLASGRLDEAARRRAARQLAACEGSDWFWWMGREHRDSAAFEALFRAHLANLYAGLALPVPASLAPP
jgi:alpha-amylase/alpha-mannosidase (GH57 family)